MPAAVVIVWPKAASVASAAAFPASKIKAIVASAAVRLVVGGQPTLLTFVLLPACALDEKQRDGGGEDQQRQQDVAQQGLRIHCDVLLSLAL
jgi:hypothetical protein